MNGSDVLLLSNLLRPLLLLFLELDTVDSPHLIILTTAVLNELFTLLWILGIIVITQNLLLLPLLLLVLETLG